MRVLVGAMTLLVAACGGGSSELAELAGETCSVLSGLAADPAEASLRLFEATATAADFGFTEQEFLAELRVECPESVIIGGAP